ncbi:MAG: GNAT family N-acetyltransferase [bacterium]
MAKRLKGKALEEFKNAVKLRPFESRDAEPCNTLYNLVFKQERTVDQWRWLYEERPRGGHATFVAELDGEIIGQYPTVFTLYKLGDREVLAADHIDASMKREYQGTGVYSKMGNMHHECFDLVFGMGFPTPIYYRFGSKTLGYIGVSKVPKWLKIFRSERIIERTVPVKPFVKLAGALCKPATQILFRAKEKIPLEGFAFEKVEAFDGRVDALWERVKEDRPFLLVRDSAFLNWRFRKNPFRRFDLFHLLRGGEVIGYVVCTVAAFKRGRKGFLADLLVIRDPEAEKAAIGFALEHFRSCGADYVICLMLDKYYMDHLKRFGFVRIPTRTFLAFKNFNPGKINSEKLCIPDNWYISGADADWV